MLASGRSHGSYCSVVNTAKWTGPAIKRHHNNIACVRRGCTATAYTTGLQCTKSRRLSLLEREERLQSIVGLFRVQGKYDRMRLHSLTRSSARVQSESSCTRRVLESSCELPSPQLQDRSLACARARAPEFSCQLQAAAAAAAEGQWGRESRRARARGRRARESCS